MIPWNRQEEDPSSNNDHWVTIVFMVCSEPAGSKPKEAKKPKKLASWASWLLWASWLIWAYWLTVAG